MEIIAPSQKEIDFRGKQSQAWKYLTDNTTKEIFYGGAAGGGKSFLGCVWHIYRRTTFAKTRGMIGRAKITALEQSTLKTLIQATELMGYVPGVHFNYNAHKHIITWNNGSETILKDLFLYPSDPDFISLGSTEYTDVFIDEGAEITLKAFDIANSRIRWMLTDYNLVPKILVTCNPSPGWIKNNYITNPETNTPIQLKPYQKFVTALVTDNPNKDFVTLYSEQLSKMSSEYDKQRLLYGNWDVSSDVSNPFAFNFSPIHHTGAVTRHDHKRIIVSIDFNLNPFACTLSHVWRDMEGLHIHVFKELSIDNGSIQSMADKLRAELGDRLGNCYITGDAMGNIRNITQADNASNYLMLSRMLNVPENSFVIRSNPTHDQSRNDVNTMLWLASDPSKRVEFKINQLTCPGTYNDFRQVQCDAYGQILKRDRKDLSQRADFIDTIRYLVHYFVSPEIRQYIRK